MTGGGVRVRRARVPTRALFGPVLAAWGVAMLVLAAGLGTSQVRAAELVMFEEPGCVWCRRFDREIAPAYPKTDEGALAPLRRMHIAEQARTGVRLARPVTVTPTFVLADGGVEVGRITGYPGEEFFWGLLGELLARLPRAAPPPLVVRPRDVDARPARRGRPDQPAGDWPALSRAGYLALHSGRFTSIDPVRP